MLHTQMLLSFGLILFATPDVGLNTIDRVPAEELLCD